ncbi:MAG: tetratricopeptide repeat protein [Bacteriovoracaceae bacterium]
MKLDTLNSLYEKANQCFEKREYRNAEVLLGEIIESSVEKEEDQSLRSKAYFLLGNIFHRRGEIGKAIRSFETCLSIDSTHTDAAISLSVVLNDIGQYDRAKRVFERANSRVKNESARDGSGRGVKDQHINKNFSAKHFELAELYYSYQRFDEAIFEYTKSFQLSPTNYEARVKLAKTYSKKGFTDKAILELQKLKNEVPNYIPGRIALGVLYYGTGKVLEAQAEWSRVLSLEPKNKEAKMYLGFSKTASETVVSL